MSLVPWTLGWFVFPGWFRLDGWLLGRMASCQHLQSPALSGRLRQLVESSSRPATVLEDQGESLEWSLMLLMEVCGSEYALPDFFPHVLSYCMTVSRQGGEKSAQKKIQWGTQGDVLPRKLHMVSWMLRAIYGSPVCVSQVKDWYLTDTGGLWILKLEYTYLYFLSLHT